MSASPKFNELRPPQTSSLALLNILNDILDASRLEYDRGIDLTWHVARSCPAALHSDDARLRQARRL
eukprot:tig00000227_g19817.t1